MSCKIKINLSKQFKKALKRVIKLFKLPLFDDE